MYKVGDKIQKVVDLGDDGQWIDKCATIRMVDDIREEVLIQHDGKSKREWISMDDLEDQEWFPAKEIPQHKQV